MARRRRPAVTIPQLARLLNRVRKINIASVHRWAKNGLLPLAISTRGKRIVKREVALEVFRDWKCTCGYTEAANLLGVPGGSIKYFIRKGIITSIDFFGTERIIIASIDLTKRSIGLDVVNPDKVGFARYPPEKRKELSEKGHNSPNRQKFSSEHYRNLGRNGGKASVESGKGHRWTREEALEQGSPNRWNGETAILASNRARENRLPR